MRFSWLKSRQSLIFLITIDLIIYLSILFSLEENIIKDLLFHSTNILIWIITGYIIGRYKYLKESRINLYSKQFLKSFLLTFLFFNYLQIFGKYDTSILLNFVLISQFSHVIINEFRNKKTEKKKFFYIGSDEIFSLLKKELNKESALKSLKKLDINSKKYPKKIKYIILDSKYKLSKEEVSYIDKLDKNNIEIINSIDWFELHLQRLHPHLINNSEVFKSQIYINRDSLQSRLKRVSDIFISLIILLFSSPLILISIIFIKIEDNGNIIYSQKRTGLDQKIIKIYKLRTMIINAEKKGVKWAKKNDNRITKVGKFLRLSRLDEIPQLFSVIKGEMSLIGPRPERPEIEEKLEKVIPSYRIRHLVKPGLSGWAQVNYPYGSSIKDSENKLSYDLYYILNISIFLDLLILFKTMRLIFNLKGAIPKK